jgi:hypothetical protein
VDFRHMPYILTIVSFMLGLTTVITQLIIRYRKRKGIANPTLFTPVTMILLYVLIVVGAIVTGMALQAHLKG